MPSEDPPKLKKTLYQDVEVPFHPILSWQPRRASAPMGHLHLPSPWTDARMLVLGAADTYHAGNVVLARDMPVKKASSRCYRWLLSDARREYDLRSRVQGDATTSLEG